MKLKSKVQLAISGISVLLLALLSAVADPATTPGAGSDSGTSSAFRFNLPDGVALDRRGNIYVADNGNDTICKITGAGEVTILAGSPGQQGSTDGIGSSARFNGPDGLAADGSGNIYVADNGNSTIRKITPGGVVTTIAGSPGQQGSADGTGSGARFNLLNAGVVAVDDIGNVYVADSGNNTIRKITSTGVVITLAGSAGLSGSSDGTGSAARFEKPNGIAVDGSGNVYVADAGNATIRKIDPGGVVTTLAGYAGQPGSDDGTGGEARFGLPLGLALDGSGNVYVADGAGAIRKVTPGGVVTTLAGYEMEIQPGSSDGSGSVARFRAPTGLAVDGGGNVYVADAGNAAIRKITPSGIVTTLDLQAFANGTAGPRAGHEWRSSQGVRFVPAGTNGLLFSIWDVRVKDFAAFVDATGYDAIGDMYSLGSDGYQQRGDTWKSPGFTQTENDPVVGVNWFDAKAYCEWLTKKEQADGRLASNQEYRLPTDEEWSRAVGLDKESGSTPFDKGNSKKGEGIYPWGTQWPPPDGAGNYAGDEAHDSNWPNRPSFKTIVGYNDGYPRTSPVGSFRANTYGLYDMGGNVWQLCDDSYDGGKDRVVRGASWDDNNYDILDPNTISGSLFLSAREPCPTDYRCANKGFRVVLVVSPP